MENIIHKKIKKRKAEGDVKDKRKINRKKKRIILYKDLILTYTKKG
jgi:hypothetical protein